MDFNILIGVNANDMSCWKMALKYNLIHCGILIHLQSVKV